MTSPFNDDKVTDILTKFAGSTNRTIMEYNSIEETIARIIVMAKLDEEIQDSELNFIYGLAEKCGLNNSDLQDIIENAESIAENQELNTSNKVEYFYQVLIFALADGNLAKTERDYLLELGQRMGFEEDKLEIVLDRAQELTEDELTVESIKKLWE